MFPQRQQFVEESSPRYQYGIQLMQKGHFWKAEKVLRSLGHYQDSENLAVKCAEIKKFEKRMLWCLLIPFVGVIVGLIIAITKVIPLRLAALKHVTSK